MSKWQIKIIDVLLLIAHDSLPFEMYKTVVFTK